MTRVVYLTLIRIDDDLIELYVIVHNLDTQSLGSWGSLGRIWAGCGHILWAAGTLREHMLQYDCD